MDREIFNGINLDLLTDRQRKAVKCVLEGKSLKEAAREIGCTKQNVSDLIKRAQNCSRLLPNNSFEVLKEINLDLLTNRQRIAVIHALDGKSIEEISKDMDSTTKNVKSLLKRAQCRSAQEVNQKKPRTANIDNYERYRGVDISILSPREKQALLFRLDRFTYGQIAEKMETSISTVGALLSDARLKLEGRYNRDVVNQRERERRKRHPEKTKEARKKQYMKQREKRISDMREYNKIYYQKHKKEILEKKRKAGPKPD